MEVSTWDPYCEHTMTTNHLELAPGQYCDLHESLSPSDYTMRLFGLSRSHRLHASDGYRGDVNIAGGVVFV